MNWQPQPETRREPIPGGSTAASMRLTVSGRDFQFMSLIFLMEQWRSMLIKENVWLSIIDVIDVLMWVKNNI